MTKPKYPRGSKPKRKLRLYKKHGLTGTVAYKRWRKMKDRCESKSSGSYARYGGAGVTFCERWIDFENFFADMGEPSEGIKAGKEGCDDPDVIEDHGEVAQEALKLD
jgi:hypothetical protein